MTDPTTSASAAGDRTPEPVAAALVGDGGTALRIEPVAHAGRPIGYSILVRGDVHASSILSTTAPREEVMLLDDDTKLLTGTVSGGTAGFVLDGRIVAAEFDDPKPIVRLGDAVVDPGRWPTVAAYTGAGGPEEPAEGPLPNGGELDRARGDPLAAEEYVVVLEGEDLEGSSAYCFDVDGTVLESPDSATVSPTGDRVYGYLCPGWSARIAVRGVVTRIDAGSGIGHSVRTLE